MQEQDAFWHACFSRWKWETCLHSIQNWWPRSLLSWKDPPILFNLHRSIGWSCYPLLSLVHGSHIKPEFPSFVSRIFFPQNSFNRIPSGSNLWELRLSLQKNRTESWNIGRSKKIQKTSRRTNRKRITYNFQEKFPIISSVFLQQFEDQKKFLSLKLSPVASFPARTDIVFEPFTRAIIHRISAQLMRGRNPRSG